MPRLSRRSFLGWLGTLAAALGLDARARAHAAPTRSPDPEPEQQGAPLDAVMLAQLGEVVLPAELGKEGIGRVSHSFASWIAGYRKGAELVHAYGSSELRFLGDSPLPRWRQQLGALQRAARAKHGRSFGTLSRTDREGLVRAALAPERLDRLGAPLSANHVAVALLSYFLHSPEATDLCYRARISPNQCRPLLESSRAPLPLAPRRTGGDAPASTHYRIESLYGDQRRDASASDGAGS